MGSIHGGLIPKMYVVTMMVEYVGFPRTYPITQPVAATNDDEAVETGRLLLWETIGRLDGIRCVEQWWVTEWSEDGGYREAFRDRERHLAS